MRHSPNAFRQAHLSGYRLGAAAWLACGVLFAAHADAQDCNNPAMPDASTSNTQDRDQMACQLGITFPDLPPKLEDANAPANTYPASASDPEGNWTDAAGHTITRSGFGLWNNYDDIAEGYFPGPESWRVGDYTPIDLLKMNNGTPVTTPEQWWTQRRPEIFHDVQEELYGFIPDESLWPDLTWAVSPASAGAGADGVAYVEWTVTGTFDVAGYGYTPRNVPTLSFVVRVPEAAVAAGEPVPAIITFGLGAGVPALSWSYVSSYAPGQPNNVPGSNGFGMIAYNAILLQPDMGGANLSSYIIGMINHGNWRSPSDWGTLAAWGWGISRFLDFLEEPNLVGLTGADLIYVNPCRVGVEGHSRYGKASLVAMAYEPRLLAAFPSCGGSLGPAQARRHWGQDLENSSWDQEYHWMAGNFLNYMGELVPGQYMPRKAELLTVDAHSLVGLSAPRPMLLNGGDADTWTDPYGMYLTGVDGSPAYALLGRPGIVVSDAPPLIDTPYLDGHIGYRYHTGGHTDTPDWPAFVELAARFFTDDEAPDLAAVLPADQTLNVSGPGGAVATYAAVAPDNVNGNVGVQFDPPSGSVFPIGETIVTATVKDVSCNTATDTFKVTVVDGDVDGDGVNDSTDNCINVANADQCDTDGDGFGNLCDADITNNGVVNFADLSAMKAAFYSSPADSNWNPNADLNCNDVVNNADLAIMKQQFGGPPGPSGTTAF